MSNQYLASCLCAGVTFSAQGFGDLVANCHCAMCRKFHGAAFATLVEVKGLKWLSGQDLLKNYRAANGTVRTFCGCCGASIGFRSKDAAMDDMEIAISLFDQAIPVRVDAEIYTHYKANWCVLLEDVPAYPEGRD
ncbi:GFA family protein [Marinomonas sp. THO17]|uniref:GFA family protein n=1 Tax=Marinomonas sp. THO17 TaxID=3149048 RepID=UPI00336BCDFD